MPIITLPDGTEKKYDSAVTIEQIASEIVPALAPYLFYFIWKKKE